MKNELTSKTIFMDECCLQDQICVVTGSSRGIGRAIAVAFARHGADVAVNYYKNKSAAESTAEEIASLGRQVIPIQADITRPDDARRLIETAHEHFGRLDILVNNIGRFEMKTIAETSIEEWRGLFDMNLNAAFYCAKSALPIMRAQRKGHLIFLGTTKANTIRSHHNAAAYGAAKTALTVLVKSLAREEGPNGIRSNIINPGIIDTGHIPATQQSYANQIALKEFGREEDIANAALYLASPLGRYCNGAAIDVDGGLWI